MPATPSSPEDAGADDVAQPPCGGADLAWAGTLITSLLALTVSVGPRVDDKPWLRWLLAFVVALSPVALSEITGNITNLNWTLFAVSFWLIASPRRPRPTRHAGRLVGLGRSRRRSRW